MQLSENFSLAELTNSQTATRKGISNEPTDDHIANLMRLVENILQPCRDEFGAIIITSGYRSAALNEAIGGSTRSQHSKGEAADFHAKTVDCLALGKWIANNLDFDQLIFEFIDSPTGGWIHCSSSGDNRGEILKAEKQNGKTVYTQMELF